MQSGIFWKILIYHLLLYVNASPQGPRAADPLTNTHIISFVAQRKTSAKYAEIKDFDFENFDDTSRNENYYSMNGAIEQLFGRLLEPPTSTKQPVLQKFAKLQKIDDLDSSSENTLESTNIQFGNDTHHESSKNPNDTSLNVYHRFKQSIPVLEPVRHLLNAVREGNFNHTTHFNHSSHHLVSPGEGGNGESSAIETMADRENVENSVSFNVLDILGKVGGKIWSFLMNLFAASSNASAGSSIGGNLK